MPDTAAEILARSAAAYAGCTSYRDDGVVTTAFYSPARRVVNKPFKTRFVRGENGGFLFEYKSRRGEEDWDTCAVWLENGQVRAWSSQLPLESGGSLDMALSALTGVSGGSAWRIPSLLMPEVVAERTRPKPDAVVLEIAEAHALGCAAVEVRNAMRVEQIWIDRSTWLIRRVASARKALGPPSAEAIESLRAKNPAIAADLEQSFRTLSNRPPTEVDSSTSYEACFNQAITADELRFTPPTA